MSRTRAELDSKITRLQARVGELTPQRLGERYVPDYFVDRLIGGVLTLVGLKMAWSQYRSHRRHQARVRDEALRYAAW
jgi:hypothetical protein